MPPSGERRPLSVGRRSLIAYTNENSGWRSWARPAGFQEAAVPSSDTATKASAMPAARAPDRRGSGTRPGPPAPRRPARAASAADRRRGGAYGWRSIGASRARLEAALHDMDDELRPSKRGDGGHDRRGRARRAAGRRPRHPRHAVPLDLQRLLAAGGDDRGRGRLRGGRARLLRRAVAALAGPGRPRRAGRGHGPAARRVGPEPGPPPPGRRRRLPAHGRLRGDGRLGLLVGRQRALRPAHRAARDGRHHPRRVAGRRGRRAPGLGDGGARARAEHAGGDGRLQRRLPRRPAAPGPAPVRATGDRRATERWRPRARSPACA